MGHFDTQDARKTHKLYCRRVETTGQVFLLPESNRKDKFTDEPYTFPNLTHFYYSFPYHFSSIFNMIKFLFAYHIYVFLSAVILLWRHSLSRLI